MSETKEKSNKVYSIPKSEMVSVKITGFFYGRLLGLYIVLANKYTVEQLTRLNQAINTDKISTLNEDEQLDAAALETILILKRTIEMRFKEEDKLTLEELDIPPTSD